MKARPQPNSGAGPIHKEDAKNEKFLFQIKSALKEGQKQIVVKKEDLEELRLNAIDCTRIPAFVLDFRDDNEWIALQRGDLEALFDEIDLCH